MSAEIQQQCTFGNHAYLLSLDEGLCYVFSTRNNCCEFLASDDVILKVITIYISKGQFVWPVVVKVKLIQNTEFFKKIFS